MVIVGPLFLSKTFAIFSTIISCFFFLLSCLETNKQVIVWIHGGAFIFGGIGVYNPEYIMEENVVLVTIQYRLNIFGFMSTEDSVAPGNYGMYVIL